MTLYKGVEIVEKLQTKRNRALELTLNELMPTSLLNTYGRR